MIFWSIYHAGYRMQMTDQNYEAKIKPSEKKKRRNDLRIAHQVLSVVRKSLADRSFDLTTHGEATVN